MQEKGNIYRTIIEGNNNSYVKIKKKAEIFARGIEEAISWEICVVGEQAHKNMRAAVMIHNDLCKEFKCNGTEMGKPKILSKNGWEFHGNTK